MDAQRGGVAQGPVRLGGDICWEGFMEGTASCKEEVHKSIGTQVQVGEVQSMDVVQFATVWTSLGQDVWCGIRRCHGWVLCNVPSRGEWHTANLRGGG